ncbi:hypothetical protein SASPL_104588 [Salvia splendens]|uniref:Uncharacterized protein n=1 Tax=Salvia splendens TaxID=180675 RepID=A0A8X9A8J5_SALSN|nr:hypothetical protein SASPL_104588 [Salvia splendens]
MDSIGSFSTILMVFESISQLVGSLVKDVNSGPNELCKRWSLLIVMIDVDAQRVLQTVKRCQEDPMLLAVLETMGAFLSVKKEEEESWLKDGACPLLSNTCGDDPCHKLISYTFRISGSIAGCWLSLSQFRFVLSSRSDDINSLSRLEGGVSCSLEVPKIIPILKKTYGDSMKKILHVGPETCSVVSQLLKQEDTEAWGIEPYELDDADSSCKSLVRKGIVRVVDIKFPLPYRPKTFSLVIVSDALVLERNQLVLERNQLGIN